MYTLYTVYRCMAVYCIPLYTAVYRCIPAVYCIQRCIPYKTVTQCAWAVYRFKAQGWCEERCEDEMVSTTRHVRWCQEVSGSFPNSGGCLARSSSHPSSHHPWALNRSTAEELCPAPAVDGLQRRQAYSGSTGLQRLQTYIGLQSTTSTPSLSS